MAFPNQETFLYTTSSELQAVLVRTVVVPLIELEQTPASITNSLQAHFLVRVLDSVLLTDLPLANLYYHFGFSGSYIPLGAGRELNAPVPAGDNEITFTAELNGTYVDIPVSFNWIVDTTRPTVVTTQPTNNASNININPTLLVNFSENMRASETISSVTISPPVNGTWSVTNNVLSFNSTSPLSYGQAYSVTIGTGAQDLAGNNLATPYTFNFATNNVGNQPPDAPNFDGLFVPIRTSDPKPMLSFNVPFDVDNDALHFIVEISTNSSFSSGILTYNTINHPTFFAYYNNSIKTEPFPISGVPANTGQVVFKTPVALANGQYWLRVFADDRR